MLSPYVRPWTGEWKISVKNQESTQPNQFASWKRLQHGMARLGSWNSSQAHILPFLPPRFLIPSAACFSAVIANNMLGIESELFSTGVSHMFIIENVFAFSLQHTAYTDAAWLWIHSWERRGTGRWSEIKLVRVEFQPKRVSEFHRTLKFFCLASFSVQNAWVAVIPSRGPFPLRHSLISSVIPTQELF